MNVLEMAQQAKTATTLLLSISEVDRIRALMSVAEKLKANSAKILSANQLDLDDAKKNNLSAAMTDRLTLSEKSVQGLSQMCLDVAGQPQVVGSLAEEYKRPNGLLIQKERIPIGVIGMIFESRPNVVVDGAALAIKSGNAIILKGGKEAQYSNRALYEVISEAIKGILPDGSVSLIETREDVAELLKLHQYIDLMVPRGGSSLIEHVRKNATMPVVAHDKGLCHLYVHKDADQKRVIPIILNAKTQRPGVCNALESLLIHKDYPEIRFIIDSLIEAGVEVRGGIAAQDINSKVKLATEEDYATEWLAPIISLKIVDNENEALERIRKYTSHHTEAILAKDPKVIEKFLNSLDSSALMVNASTRFNDGGELGLGAELGISTSKLHAYGPMGAKEMTTTRFLVRGTGQIRT
jgi:glutamate-5-semialdehyde dehydrogenase